MRRVERAPGEESTARRWPPCRSWTGASSTTCTGPAVATPTSTTWSSAPAGCSSSTRRPGPATSRWPTACCGRTGYRRERHVLAAIDAAMAVAELVPGLDPTAVKPVLCFDRDEPVFGWSHEVMVCSTANVATLLTSRPAVLDGATLRATAESLAQSLKAATDPIAPVPPKRQLPKKGHRAGTTRRRQNLTRSAVSIIAFGLAGVPRPRDGAAPGRLDRRGPGPQPDRSGPRPRRDRDREGEPAPARAAALGRSAAPYARGAAPSPMPSRVRDLRCS